MIRQKINSLSCECAVLQLLLDFIRAPLTRTHPCYVRLPWILSWETGKFQLNQRERPHLTYILLGACWVSCGWLEVLWSVSERSLCMYGDCQEGVWREKKTTSTYICFHLTKFFDQIVWTKSFFSSQVFGPKLF